MVAAAECGHMPVLRLLGQWMPASSTRAVLSPPQGPLEAAAAHGQLPALTYLMDELCPQLDILQLATMAQEHDHIHSYLQQRMQDALLSASAMLASSSIRPWDPQLSLSRTSSTTLPTRLTDGTGTHPPSLSSSGTPTPALSALNVAAPPFVPGSPSAASVASPKSLRRAGDVVAPERGLSFDSSNGWHLAEPMAEYHQQAPIVLPPLLSSSWARAVRQPGSLKYSPPREVYALACKPKQLQHMVQAAKLDVNSVSNGMSAMTLACRCVLCMCYCSRDHYMPFSYAQCTARDSNGPAVCELLAAGARAVELDSRMLLWLAEYAPHALPGALIAGAEVVKKDATGNAALVTARCAAALSSSCPPAMLVPLGHRHRTQNLRLYRVIIEACCRVPHAQDLFVMVATYGNYKAVTDMLEVGTINVNAPCSSGMVALLEATRNAHEAVVDRLLSDDNLNLEVAYEAAIGAISPPSPVRKARAHTPAGMTALVLAATNFASSPSKFAHIIAVLIDAGADTHVTDEQENTVLVRLVMYGLSRTLSVPPQHRTSSYVSLAATRSQSTWLTRFPRCLPSACCACSTATQTLAHSR